MEQPFSDTEQETVQNSVMPKRKEGNEMNGCPPLLSDENFQDVMQGRGIQTDINGTAEVRPPSSKIWKDTG